jgi:hypothetical protein
MKNVKQFLLVSTLVCSSLVFAQEFKIPKNNTNHTEIDFNSEKVVPSTNSKNPMKPKSLQDKKEGPVFTEKKYSEVKYNHDNDWYSIINHDADEYQNFLDSISLPESAVKNLVGKNTSTNALMLNAFLNDYKNEKPEIAENYYLEFNADKKMSFNERKIRYVDYLIRTNRPEKVLEELKSVDCNTNGKYMSKCYYYIGVAKYLTTGQRDSVELRISKDYIEKAKEIYKQ